MMLQKAVPRPSLVFKLFPSSSSSPPPSSVVGFGTILARGQRQSRSSVTMATAAPALSSPSPSPSPSSSPLVVVSFYKFANLPDHAQMRKPLADLCEDLCVSGGIILADEGINGSICGTKEAVYKVLESIQADERLGMLRHTESPAGPEDEMLHHGHTQKSPLGAGDDAPFRWGHVRVKVKKEVVPLGVPGVSPAKKVGTYVKPKEWNALIQEPDIVVIDVRNKYETRIGKFKGAVDPHTASFKEFPSWVEQSLVKDSSVPPKLADGQGIDKAAPQRIAMYCTGGIRCEKASSLLLDQGFTEVYHLEGGILKYLEEVPASESLWEGECFVFDKRVSVEHGLKQGSYKLCYACKKPVSDEDKGSPLWEEGVSCPYCFHHKSKEEKERARARQRQFETWGVIGGPDKGQRPASPKRQGISSTLSSKQLE